MLYDSLLFNAFFSNHLIYLLLPYPLNLCLVSKIEVEGFRHSYSVLPFLLTLRFLMIYVVVGSKMSVPEISLIIASATVPARVPRLRRLSSLSLIGPTVILEVVGPLRGRKFRV